MKLIAAAMIAAALLLPGPAAHAQGLSFPGPTVENIKKRGNAGLRRRHRRAGLRLAGQRRQMEGASTSPIVAPSPPPLSTDPEKVRYVPTTAAARFTILQSGEIDVLIRDSTLTFIRNTQLGLDEIAVNFYAGEGFLVSKKLGVSKITELNGATICVITGATLELNIADFARSNGTKIGTLLFDKTEEAVQAMEAGRCDGYTDDTGSLAGMRSTLKTPDDWVVLDGVISKEPLGMHARAGDPAWSRILFWTAQRAADRRGTRGDQGERRPDEGDQQGPVRAPAARRRRRVRQAAGAG